MTLTVSGFLIANLVYRWYNRESKKEVPPDWWYDLEKFRKKSDVDREEK